MMKKINIILPISLIIILCFFSYCHGLAGDFLFDDYPNLKYLGDMGGVIDWKTLNLYISSGWSGPTGRPISLLSFLIDDNNWPSIAQSFKYTSLCFHLITGLLLTWAIYLLLRCARYVEQRAAWISIVAASLWMLHPYWVSTTLYVVQRMTILSGLFMLAGMVGYLKGRLWLMQPPHHRKYAPYILMTLSAGLGTLLAVLSKENGALLPLLLLVIEIFLRRIHADSSPHRGWIAIVLGLPTLFVLIYLAKSINFSPNIWPNRPFDQVERIYSQTRILWDYVGQLWLPRIEGSGLFQDGFEISRSLFQPINTAWATLAWVSVIVALPWIYRRLPFVWLAVVFFLCGHLIESTVIGLELHFEHRNYAPAFLMFLPLAIGIDWLGQRCRPQIALAATLALILMLASMTWQRSQLWASADRLQTYWAMNDPNSARGRNYLISHLVDQKKYSEALAWADRSVQELPNSSLLTMSWLRIHINTGQATDKHFEQAAAQLVNQAFDAQTVAGLRILVDDVLATPELFRYSHPLLNLMEHLAQDGPYKRFALFMRIISYSKARLHLQMGNIQQAQELYLEAIDRYGQASSAMQMFAEMANAGRTEAALQLLDHAQLGIESGKLKTKPLNQDHYRQEILRMRQILASDR